MTVHLKRLLKYSKIMQNIMQKPDCPVHSFKILHKLQNVEQYYQLHIEYHNHNIQYFIYLIIKTILFDFHKVLLNDTQRYYTKLSKIITYNFHFIFHFILSKSGNSFPNCGPLIFGHFNRENLEIGKTRMLQNNSSPGQGGPPVRL